MSAHICGAPPDKMKRPQRLPPLPGGMELSPDKRYRYSLWCRWTPGPTITWIMFNPSDADLADRPGYIRPDPTINKIIGYSKRHKPLPFGAIRVVNLFAWRDSCTACTLLRPDPLGENDSRLKLLLRGVDEVAIAWGGLGSWRKELNVKAQARERVVRESLGENRLLCLCRVDNGRYPGHPMYKSPDLTLKDWDAAPPCP
jgi:hypothetical protein